MMCLEKYNNDAGGEVDVSVRGCDGIPGREP